MSTGCRVICYRIEEHRREQSAASQVVWTVLVEAIPTVGKNTQQIKSAILKQVKAYEKLLNAFCSSARVEGSLIVHLQVQILRLVEVMPTEICAESTQTIAL